MLGQRRWCWPVFIQPWSVGILDDGCTTGTMLCTKAGLMLARRLCRWPTFSVASNMTRCPNIGLMLTKRRRQWANNSPALGQRLLFDLLHDIQRERTDTKLIGRTIRVRCKAICPHLYRGKT